MSDLSPWESEILHFPDPDARAIRRCTPIVWDTPVPGVHGEQKWRRGAWFPSGPKADEGIICWDKWCGVSRVEERVYAGRVRIDLQDATGRAHLAWWMARTECPTIAPHELEAVRFHRQGNGWMLYLGEHRHPIGWTDVDVELDPDDARTLPDGSRLVDALALGIIARHVAGLPIPPRPTS